MRRIPDVHSSAGTIRAGPIPCRSRAVGGEWRFPATRRSNLQPLDDLFCCAEQMGRMAAGGRHPMPGAELPEAAEPGGVRFLFLQTQNAPPTPPFFAKLSHPAGNSAGTWQVPNPAPASLAFST